MHTLRVTLAAVATLGVATSVVADGSDEAADARPRRLLLIGQGPDGHPFATHEYMSGVGLVAKMLQSQTRVQPVVVQADGEWKDGPELLDGADGVFLFVSEGAKWTAANPNRLAAFQRLARRGGGLSVLHWGMGTKDAANTAPFVSLFGGCHGGPDRKYQVVRAKATPSSQHAILAGVTPFEHEEEYYYALKFPSKDGGVSLKDDGVTPLLRVPLDGADHTVSWAWERPDGGRSFGFTGLHFHRNWEHPSCRRLVAQGVLWTLKLPVPEGGLKVEVSPEDLKVPPRDTPK